MKTGIRIHTHVTAGSWKMGGLLGKIGLAKLVQYLGRNQFKVIRLDGVEHREPLYEPCTLECTPGEHELYVFMIQKGLLPGPEVAASTVSGRNLQVAVPEGELVDVVYTPRGAFQTTLELGRMPT